MNARKLDPRLLLVPTLALLAACGGDSDPTGPDPTEPVAPASIEIVAGNEQINALEATLAEPLVVLVTGTDDAPMAGVQVSFTVTSGGGSLGAATVTTGGDGRAQTVWTLGDQVGEQKVDAVVSGLSPVTFSAEAIDVSLCGTQNVNRRLHDVGLTYVLCGSGLSVTGGALLEVDPGVTVLAESGGSLRIRTDGALRAAGTEDAPIRFLGQNQTAGSWGGIWIESNDDRNELEYVEIAYGGNGDRSNLELSASASVRISHSTFRDGADYGIRATTHTVRLPDFAANQLKDNAVAGMRISANQIRYMDAATSFSGNGKDVVEVNGATLTEPQTLRAASVPYRVTNGIDISTDVSVEPGVEMHFAGSPHSLLLRVRTDGSMSAVGTADAPIRFMSETPAPGSWGGLWIESNSDANELKYVEIAYGGNGDRSNLELSASARVKITYSTFRDGADYGIRVSTGTVTLPEFESNQLLGNALSGMRITGHQIRFMDALTTFFQNGKDVIEVSGATITTAQSWGPTSAPFLLTNGIDISADVTVEPGFHMLMSAVHNMTIRVRTDGSLSAVGNELWPIRFLGENDTAGTWGGLWFESNSSDNQLEYVEIAHGGSGDFSNIYLSGGSYLSVKNSNIRDSAAWGIYVGGSTATLVQSDNQFSGNTDGDIRWP